MTERLSAQQWLARHTLSALEIDCVIALMLKILDGKCRMNTQDKTLIAQLYQHCQEREGQHLGGPQHALIAQGLTRRTPALIEQIYEQRVLAETMISRPVMKGFKARLRAQGLLPASH